METLIDKLELQIFLALVASNRAPPPSPWTVIILIDARACKRDIMVYPKWSKLLQNMPSAVVIISDSILEMIIKHHPRYQNTLISPFHSYD